MIYGDYHTHTVYSHGKGSLMENAARASDIGLRELATTDHGFMHRSYNVRRMDWPFMIKDTVAAVKQFPKLKIFLGLESNILDRKGTIDAEDHLASVDVLICGFHRYTHATSIGEIFAFNAPIFMAGLMHKSTAKRVVANTDAYVAAMERYPIDIIAHPNYGLKLDLKELARAAAHFGTFLELNGKKISFSKEDAHTMLGEGAKFILNSDSHSPSRVGEVGRPLQFIREAGIPFESVANWDRRPGFRGQK
ncbi:MAG: PHP domain-containing protein [Firmicutes bacterium]|nr:PHP domain-containing protein [Bacillota bacterium]